MAIGSNQIAPWRPAAAFVSAAVLFVAAAAHGEEHPKTGGDAPEILAGPLLETQAETPSRSVLFPPPPSIHHDPIESDASFGRTFELVEAAKGDKQTEELPLYRPEEPEGHAFEYEFPEEAPPFFWEVVEFFPTVITKPHEPLAETFSHLLFCEHDEVESELEEEAIGIQPIPERPPLLIEWNEEFLAPGFLSQGIETPTGAIWRPSLWVFGQFRSALQYFDNQRTDPIAEWANQLDLFGQLNLSGTERVLVALRPLDEERGSRRVFSGVDLHNGGWINGLNADIQTLFFEGDFGEIFPRLDPTDHKHLDYGFSVGRMPILAQQGLLINEDRIDALTVTRNTLYGNGNLNLRGTGFYAWNEINRNSPTDRANEPSDSQMVGILTETDVRPSTINADAVYVFGDEMFGDLLAFGVSTIQRHYLYHNTYNTSLHLLASFPTSDTTPWADQGELLFAQTSWTPHHTHDLIYLNAFWAIDQFTSPTRGPLMGGPLGQTGILFAAPGLGRAGPPVAVRTNDAIGASLGYQWFFDHTRTQLIWEFGGQKETEGPSRGALATGLRYQKALGQHFIFILDGFVTKQESVNTAAGARSEILVKF